MFGFHSYYRRFVLGVKTSALEFVIFPAHIRFVVQISTLGHSFPEKYCLLYQLCCDCIVKGIRWKITYKVHPRC